MGYQTMKIAKPSQKDIELCYQFARIFEALMDRWADIEDWKSWPEDTADRQLLEDIRKEYIQDEGYIDPDPDIDEREVLWKYLRQFFNDNSSALFKVIMCADAAMENCFDNTDNTTAIEYNEKINKALELLEEKEGTSNE